MKKCDVCGTETDVLTALKEQYATKVIKDICPVCNRLINDQLYKIRELMRKQETTLLKRFIFFKKSLPIL